MMVTCNWGAASNADSDTQHRLLEGSKHLTAHHEEHGLILYGLAG